MSREAAMLLLGFGAVVTFGAVWLILTFPHHLKTSGPEAAPANRDPLDRNARGGGSERDGNDHRGWGSTVPPARETRSHIGYPHDYTEVPGA